MVGFLGEFIILTATIMFLPGIITLYEWGGVSAVWILCWGSKPVETHSCQQGLFAWCCCAGEIFNKRSCNKACSYKRNENFKYLIESVHVKVNIDKCHGKYKTSSAYESNSAAFAAQNLRNERWLLLAWILLTQLCKQLFFCRWTWYMPWIRGIE